MKALVMSDETAHEIFYLWDTVDNDINPDDFKAICNLLDELMKSKKYTMPDSWQEIMSEVECDFETRRANTLDNLAAEYSYWEGIGPLAGFDIDGKEVTREEKLEHIQNKIEEVKGLKRKFKLEEINQ